MNFGNRNFPRKNESRNYTDSRTRRLSSRQPQRPKTPYTDRIRTQNYNQGMVKATGSKEPETLRLCMIDIIIGGKFVRARLKTGDQKTYVGTEVARLIKTSGNVRSSRRAVKSNNGINFEEVLMTNMGVTPSQLQELECVVDNRIPGKSATIGMRALEALKYNFRVGGKSVYMREIFDTEEVAKFSTEGEVIEEAKIPFLEEEEVILQIDETEVREIEKM